VPTVSSDSYVQHSTKVLCLYVRNRKAGPLSLEGEIQRVPGLTINQIVVPRRAGAYTPYNVSLYARWLLLGADFREFIFHVTQCIRVRG
jgi:hypothetical protein